MKNTSFPKSLATQEFVAFTATVFLGAIIALTQEKESFLNIMLIAIVPGLMATFLLAVLLSESHSEILAFFYQDQDYFVSRLMSLLGLIGASMFFWHHATFEALLRMGAPVSVSNTIAYGAGISGASLLFLGFVLSILVWHRHQPNNTPLSNTDQ